MNLTFSFSCWSVLLDRQTIPIDSTNSLPCSIIHICHYLYSLQFHRSRGPILFLADLWPCLIVSSAVIYLRRKMRFLCGRAEVYDIFIDLWVNLIVFLLVHFPRMNIALPSLPLPPFRRSLFSRFRICDGCSCMWAPFVLRSDIFLKSQSYNTSYFPSFLDSSFCIMVCIWPICET